LSFDISLTLPACQHCLRPEQTFDVADPTYNLAPLWREAFDDERGIRMLNGAVASSATHVLRLGIERMLAQPERYRKLEPANGWGDYEGAVDVLQRLLTKCQAYPKATVVIA